MIKNILLPEKFGSYYLFAKRIIGFELNKYHVFATVVYLRGTSTVIEQCLTIAIEQDNGEDLNARTAKAIKKVLGTVGGYTAIHTGLSSAQAIFKTMKLPFDDPEKIKRVVDFEVEPLLPFSISDAVIDFIITEQHPQDKSSEVLVAAVQKQYIRQTLELFSLAGVQPEVITIDLFELYGFYKMIPHYAHLTGGITLLEIDSSITRLAYLLDGQLKLIRTVPFGLAQLVKTLATDLSITQRDAMEDLVRFGFKREDDPAYLQALHKAAEEFATKIRFTLQSFTLQTEPDEQFTHIFLTGIGATVKDFDAWLETALTIPCALFNPTEITQNPAISLKKMALIPVENSISTAIAVPSPTTAHVNLRQKEFATADDQLMLKQLITTGVMLSLLFVALCVHSFMQVRTLKHALASSQHEAQDVLQEWFPTVAPGPIVDMIEEATTEAKKDEKLWFAFRRSARNSMLCLLLELTLLDRKGLDLKVEKVTIDQDRGTMVLKASVKDHDALKLLEHELRQSKTFTYVPSQPNPDFTTTLRFATGPEGDQ